MPSSDDDITPLPPAPDPQVRTLPCQRRAWCMLAEHGDEVSCVEVPRERRDVPDPLPSLRSPSFTEQLRKANSR